MIRPVHRRIAELAAGVLVLLVGWHRLAPNRGLFLAISAGTAMLAVVGYFLSTVPNPERRTGRAILLIALAVAGWIWRPVLSAALATPGEWDFLAFYLYGKVAAAGLPLYDPASFHTIAETLGRPVTPGFAAEVLNTGFPYPPPTAFLFLPLAAFDISCGNLVWQGFVALTIAGAGLLAGCLLTKTWRWEAAALGICLVLSFPPTLINQENGQTVGLLVMIACLTLATIKRPMGGGFAGLGVLVKPLFILPAAAIAAIRNWRGVLALVLVGLGAVFLAGFGLGFDQLFRYFDQSYLGNVPTVVFSDPSNQSLLATLMRATHATGTPAASPGVLPAYFAIGGLILGVGLIAARWAGRTDPITSYCVLLPAAVMVYPSTMRSYGMLLVVPLAVGVARAALEPGRQWSAILLCAIVTLIAGISVFGAALLLWGLLVWQCWQARNRPPGPAVNLSS